MAQREREREREIWCRENGPGAAAGFSHRPTVFHLHFPITSVSSHLQSTPITFLPKQIDSKSSTCARIRCSTFHLLLTTPTIQTARPTHYVEQTSSPLTTFLNFTSTLRMTPHVDLDRPFMLRPTLHSLFLVRCYESSSPVTY